MCLILCAHQPSPELALVVAANRDEFYARPALAADFWPDAPGLLAGRDQQAGGAWLGITRQGRFAAVTNFREEPPDPLPTRSRGELTTGFLTGSLAAAAYLESLQPLADEYRGYNLLLWEAGAFWHYGNRCGAPEQLPPGLHGLSNQGLNCTWPKVVQGKARLGALLQAEQEPGKLMEPLFALLMDEGDGAEHSSSFLRSAEYGTRAATVVILQTNGQAHFAERSFAAKGHPAARRHHNFPLTHARRAGC